MEAQKERDHDVIREKWMKQNGGSADNGDLVAPVENRCSNYSRTGDRRSYGNRKYCRRSWPLDRLPNIKEQMETSLKVLQLVTDSKFTLTQINGQRKLGPPPNWTGPVPGSACEVFVGKVPHTLYEHDIYPIFSSVGQIYEMRLMMDFSGMNRGYCFVMYATKEEAARAVRELDQYEICPGRRIGVVASINNCRLYVSQLPPDITAECFIKRIYGITDDVENVAVYRCPKGNTTFALISYKTHRGAAMGRRRLVPEALTLFKGAEINVEWAHSNMSPSNVLEESGTCDKDGNVHMTTTFLYRAAPRKSPLRKQRNSDQVDAGPFKQTPDSKTDSKPIVPTIQNCSIKSLPPVTLLRSNNRGLHSPQTPQKDRNPFKSPPSTSQNFESSKAQFISRDINGNSVLEKSPSLRKSPSSRSLLDSRNNEKRAPMASNDRISANSSQTCTNEKPQDSVESFDNFGKDDFSPLHNRPPRASCSTFSVGLNELQTKPIPSSRFLQWNDPRDLASRFSGALSLTSLDALSLTQNRPTPVERHQICIGCARFIENHASFPLEVSLRNGIDKREGGGAILKNVELARSVDIRGKGQQSVLSTIEYNRFLGQSLGKYHFLGSSQGGTALRDHREFPQGAPSWPSIVDHRGRPCDPSDRASAVDNIGVGRLALEATVHGNGHYSQGYRGDNPANCAPALAMPVLHFLPDNSWATSARIENDYPVRGSRFMRPILKRTNASIE
ncbi:hypothetical protein KM043_011703 [Ampulex compressa]|nr:hypothetical protein KM043_011703 [Ampulex compressa]